KKVDEPQVVEYLITTITQGKAPSDGFGAMPAKGGSTSLTDQDVKDIAAYIIQANLSGKTPLSPSELARSNVFWVTVGIGGMCLLTYLLAQYNMRWIARRAAARRGRV
ncbi:MAG: cytochrome c, partial [Chloroflexota bacterium]